MYFDMTAAMEAAKVLAVLISLDLDDFERVMRLMAATATATATTTAAVAVAVALSLLLSPFPSSILQPTVVLLHF